MNYVPSRVLPPINMSTGYPGSQRQPQIPNQRYYNQVVPTQPQFVQQPGYYPQQYNMSPPRHGRGMTYAHQVPVTIPNQQMYPYPQPNIRLPTETYSPYQNTNSPQKRSNGALFNASAPADYNKLYSNQNGNRTQSQSNNQTASTFALASNNLLRRTEVGLYQSTPSGSQNNLLSGNNRTSHNNQLYQNTVSSPHGNQLISLHTPSNTNSPLRESLVRSGAALLESPERHQPGVRITATIIPIRNNLAFSQNFSQPSSWHEEGNGPSSSRQRHNNENNQQISLFNLSNNNLHHEPVSHSGEPRGLTLRNAFLRPATVRVTIADPELTDITLTNLRNAFETDEDFGEELMRINDMINMMIGTPDNQTNWVTSFIEQFFAQVNDQPKIKVLTDDDVSKLPTKTFHAKKKGKGKKNQDETLNEDLCAICLIDYEEGDTQVILSCNHNFHHDCVGAWLKKKAECPTCRTPID